jgi:hypothetical protein
VQGHVVGQQRLEPVEVTCLGGRDEHAGQLVVLLARGLEAWLVLLDVAAGPHRQLPARGLALADDPGDGVVAVLEHLP